MMRPSTPSNNTTPAQNSLSTQTSTTAAIPQGSGKVIYSITDAATNMGAVTEVDMTASQIDMHSAANGWITVSTTPQTFNLLELNAKNQTSLLAGVNIPVGTYDQVRLTIDKIVVKTNDGATNTAKLPSGMLTVNANVVVKDGATTSVHFDFLASKSLHLTSDGKYIFAPVMHVQTKSDADVTVDANKVVTISNSKGKIDSDENVGMDINGSVKANFELDAKTQFDVVNDVIKIHDENLSLIHISEP